MAGTNLKKNKNGYGYKYTDLAQIHEYLESVNARYYQYIDRIDNDDYIMTVPIINNEELPPRRGVRIVDAVLQGIKNPAQEQGSATTYARRYSLLMAFGLATEDDDAASLTQKTPKKETNTVRKVSEKQANAIYELMIRKGLNVEEALKKNYKITNTKDLTTSQYVAIMQAMNKLPDKEVIANANN